MQMRKKNTKETTRGIHKTHNITKNNIIVQKKSNSQTRKNKRRTQHKHNRGTHVKDTWAAYKLNAHKNKINIQHSITKGRHNIKPQTKQIKEKKQQEDTQ